MITEGEFFFVMISSSAVYPDCENVNLAENKWISACLKYPFVENINFLV